MSNERILKYLVAFLLCAVVSTVYTMTKCTGVRRILRESLITFGYIAGVMLAAAVVVHLLSLLK
ncbi:MAG: hypothetical protein HYU36_11315 [Planctomycetes bacterium]|nr:hypothetical protein [Planctomycetota bacterium]